MTSRRAPGLPPPLQTEEAHRAAATLTSGRRSSTVSWPREWRRSSQTRRPSATSSTGTLSGCRRGQRHAISISYALSFHLRASMLGTLDFHFSAISSYSIDLDVEKPEDVLLHRRILDECANNPDKRPIFHARFLRVSTVPYHCSIVSRVPSH